MKNKSTLNATIGLIASLLAFSSQAEIAQPANVSQKALTYESSLSGFKSINTDSAKLSANESAGDIGDMKGMDHSKMSADDMKGMDHSKMSADDMKGMDHSKMSADEMKDMKTIKAKPKKSAMPSKVKKLKPIKKTVKPAPPVAVDPHQNHQM